MADDSNDPSQAPGLPQIRDEAAATPMWVPALGLGLFMLATVWMVLSASIEPDVIEDGAAEPVLEAPNEAPAEEAGPV